VSAAQPVPAGQVSRGDVLAYDGREMLVTGTYLVSRGRPAGRRAGHRVPGRVRPLVPVPARQRAAEPDHAGNAP